MFNKIKVLFFSIFFNILKNIFLKFLFFTKRNTLAIINNKYLIINKINILFYFFKIFYKNNFIFLFLILHNFLIFFLDKFINFICNFIFILCYFKIFNKHILYFLYFLFIILFFFIFLISVFFNKFIKLYFF